MHLQGINRRQFLKKSAIAVGGVVVTCSGITAAGLYRQPVEFPPAIVTENIDQKILVAYASLCGSTAEIAQGIARTLTSKGEMVDLMPVKDVTDLDAYKTVVLGSAIRMSKWIPEATDFVTRFQTDLAKKSTAFFTVCLTLKDDTEENREKVSTFVEPVRALIQPDREGFFAGKLNYQNLSMVEGLIMRNMIKATAGDFRNWDLIRTWAEEVIL